MFTSRQGQSTRQVSLLPRAFEQALLRVNQSVGFSEAVTHAAELADCEFLFEIPGALFGDEDGRAAVMRPFTNTNGSLNSKSNKSDILYVVFNGKNGVIRIIEAFEVPLSIHALTHSYSRVLEFLAGDLEKGFRRTH